MSRKKILVPVNINQDPAGLLCFAGNIAKKIHGRISCVNIMPEKDLSNNISDKLPLRRFVELELARTATGTLAHMKPEFDIIVTKGDFVSRLINMTEELDIDIVVAQTNDIVSLRKLHAGLSIPLIVFNDISDRICELVLPINLDDKYYYKIQSGIDIASLLQLQIKVIGYTAPETDELRYKEKLDDIRSMIQKENVACTTSFIKADNAAMVLPDMEVSPTGSLLCTYEEFDSYVTDNESFNAGFSSSITLIPVKKKRNETFNPIREHSFN